MNLNSISYKKFLKNNNNNDDYEKYGKLIKLNIKTFSMPKINTKEIDIKRVNNQYKFIEQYVKENKNTTINEWATSYYNKKPLDTYLYLFKKFIVDNIRNIENTTGLDFGGGFGFSTINYATFNPKKIYCCDVRCEKSSQKLLNDAKTELNITTELEYILNKKDNFLNHNLKNLNWVIIYDVLTCIKNYDNEDINILMYKYLEKSYNILSSEGILFIADCTKNMSSYDENNCKKKIKNMIEFEKTNESFGKTGYPNFGDLQSSQEICKMLELIGFKNIELYHYGYSVNLRFYIKCVK